MFFAMWASMALALREASRAPPPSRATATVLVGDKTVPVVWGSTVTVEANSGEDVDIGVCWKGVEEDCEEGLSAMATPEHGRCAIQLPNCECFSWVVHAGESPNLEIFNDLLNRENR